MTVNNSMMSVRTAACLTAGVLGVATLGSVVLAATTTSKVAMVAYALFATLGVGLSGASVTAAFSKESEDLPSYFATFREHAKVGMAATVQFVAQTAFQALVQGLADGISKLISRKFAGPDHTYAAQ